MKDTVTKGYKHSTVGFNKNANCMYINVHELLIYVLINVSNIYQLECYYLHVNLGIHIFDIYNHKRSIKFSMHSDVNKGTLWWQKCTLVHILMTFVNILIFVTVCWFSSHVKAKCGIVAFGFDMPTRLIASITLECNDAVTIYVHYLHQFQHIHLNYTNLKGPLV